MSQLTRPAPVPPPEVGRSPRGRHRRPARGRSVLLTLVITLFVAMVPVGASIGQALGAPGQASTSVRLVEWLRDHGGGGVVNVVENFWYARNRPDNGAPDPASIPVAPATGTTPAGSAGAGPPPLPARDGGCAALRGAMEPVGATRRRAPAALHRVLPAAARRECGRRGRLARPVLDPHPAHCRHPGPCPVVGTCCRRRRRREGPRDGTGGAAGDVQLRVQARDAQGGYYAVGREIVPLRSGAASLVIDSSGRVDVGAWGRDLGRSPGTVSVRQNLDLIVDHRARFPAWTRTRPTRGAAATTNSSTPGAPGSGSTRTAT